MNTETQETKSKGGGRPKNPVPPTTAAEVRVLMAQELTKSTPDRFKDSRFNATAGRLRNRRGEGSGHCRNREC